MFGEMIVLCTVALLQTANTTLAVNVADGDATLLYYGSRILLLAGMPLKAEAERAKRLGANGYLPKSVNQTRLMDAIRFVVTRPDDFMEESTLDEPSSLLSPREREVLEYMRIGKTREIIAQILGIGLETVRSHIKNILTKLDAENSAAAVNRAYELGILRP